MYIKIKDWCFNDEYYYNVDMIDDIIPEFFKVRTANKYGKNVAEQMIYVNHRIEKHENEDNCYKCEIMYAYYMYRPAELLVTIWEIDADEYVEHALLD